MLRSFKQDPNWKHDAPPMPRWGLERELGEARWLYSNLFESWIGRPLAPQTRDILGQEIVERLSDHRSTALVLAVQDSLTAESALPLTPRVARKFALQMACNAQALRDGRPIPKFISVSRDDTWVPLEIVSVEDSQEQGRGLRKQLSLLVIGGPLAGFEVTKTCPCGYLSHLAYDLGYTKKRKYDDQGDLLGLWLAGLIEASSSLDIQFDKYWLNSAMARRNRALVKTRRWTEAEELAGEQEAKEKEEQ